MIQEQREQLPYTRPARTTKASWPTEMFVTTDDDDHYMCAAFLDTGEGLDWAERFSACWNSYARHFGPRAVEAAESDLLGQALEACRSLVELWDAEHPDDPCACLAGSPDQPHVGPCELCQARAILAKRDAAAQEPTQ